MPTKLKKSVPHRTYLDESELPRDWYNIQADLPTPMPPFLHPTTHAPVTVDDLCGIFARPIAEQELTKERFIEIPDEVRDLYKTFRPSPLHRAYNLEKAIGTPARIYYKFEGNNPSGSHKLNSAVAQVHFNKAAGVRRITTETGGGQWGSALAIASKMAGLDCTVYMVKVSYEQKPYRRILMETYGGQVVASPSNTTEAGRKMLAAHPDSLGSLGGAISEAVEDALTHPETTRYALGSVLNHVLLHQTIIGLEAKKQMEKIDEYPDVVIGCCGGGSNFSGLAHPFLMDRLREGRQVRAVTIEPMACPSLTRGKYAYDFGDLSHFTPLMPMYTLGHMFEPPGIHAGGLRYHGVAPILAHLFHEGIVECEAVFQRDVFDAAVLFAQNEVILPAPESAHAILGAINEAKRCAQTGEEKVILFSLSGCGYFDMSAYKSYLSGNMKNYAITDELLASGLNSVSDIPIS